MTSGFAALQSKGIQLIRDDRGFVISIELVLLASIAVIGLIAGFSAMRDAVLSELSDVAGSVQSLNQSYIYYGVQGHSGATAGSSHVDRLDFCDSPGDEERAMDNCLVITSENTLDEGTEEGLPPTGR